MTRSDDEILELLAESSVAMNKATLNVNFQLEETDVSYATIKRRLPKLEKAGLVEKIRSKGSYYRITDDGYAYLAGNFVVDNIE